MEMIKYNEEFYEFVYKLKKDVYKKYVEEYFGSWDEEEQIAYFDNFINKVKDNAYIIKYQDKNVGFYNGEILENESYEIGNICIMPKYQRKGIGTKVLKDILKKYETRDITLQCFKSNPAIKLYEHLGFEKYLETEYHYKMIKHKQNNTKNGEIK